MTARGGSRNLRHMLQEIEQLLTLQDRDRKIRALKNDIRHVGALGRHGQGGSFGTWPETAMPVSLRIVMKGKTPNAVTMPITTKAI